jgi:hypothetical protein
MLESTPPVAATSGPDSGLAPLAPDRVPVPIAGGGLPATTAETTPAPASIQSRGFDPRTASPREVAKRSLDLYADGLLEWDDQAVLAFQPELHPDYDRTVGALLETKAAPDTPRDFVVEWERRLVFELRYNPENDEAVARARRIVRALVGLLPIGERMAGVLVGLPPRPRRLDRGRIVAVEQLEAAFEFRHAGGLRAVGEEQVLRPVRVLVRAGQPDRLIGGVAVGGAAVRNPGILIERPEHRVERLDPLGRAEHDHRALAGGERLLEQARQDLLQRRMAHVVERDFGHS